MVSMVSPTYIYIKNAEYTENEKNNYKTMPSHIFFRMLNKLNAFFVFEISAP